MKQLSLELPLIPTLTTNELLTLTAREWEVVLLLSDDYSAKEIAEKLCLTPKSVDNYKNTIGQKLGLQGHQTLARFARKYQSVLYQWQELFLRKKSGRPSISKEVFGKLDTSSMQDVRGGCSGINFVFDLFN